MLVIVLELHTMKIKIIHSHPSSYIRKPQCMLANVKTVASLMNAEKKVSYSYITFVVDSGASHHMISDKNYFSEMTLLESDVDINVPDKSNSDLKSRGEGYVQVLCERQGKLINITNALYLVDVLRLRSKFTNLKVKDLKLYSNLRVFTSLEEIVVISVISEKVDCIK